ncbi:uncharacterized protein LOC132696056 isoform X2 [Cylas formicarius]|nr:uncharacterized protein LOC132696056 isoform X2 [Cylas formicarius]
MQNTIEQPKVKGLDEIAGMTGIKKTLYALITLPRSQPQLFTNRSISNSFLLFGPPGTGKTRLIHALAAQSEAVLHTLSISDVMSSYVGATEKNIHNLFHSLNDSDQLKILFMDEIDSLCRKRTSSEHEYTRRIKTELMCQISRVEDCKNMVIIAVTNCPWELDTAILRRFQKRIYVPLPGPQERAQLFTLFMRGTPVLDANELEQLVQKTEGFSGSDIATLVQNALDIPIAELQYTRIWEYTDDAYYTPFAFDSNVSDDDIYANVHIVNLEDLPRCSVRARPSTFADFLEATENTQPTVSWDSVKQYEQFTCKR